MRFLFILILIPTLSTISEGVYLNNVSKIENNPAKWTEEGIWGPLLEEWALSGNPREKKVMKLPPATDAFITNIEEASKESKINTGKITNNQTKKPTAGREISETDLYLLGAIEKLVYKVDFMEKRLRRVEEMLYFVMAGNRVDQEPCHGNFTRVGSTCYFFYNSAGREYDWKAASAQCKKIGASLAELESIEENQDVVAYIQSTPHLRGKDFWTGGLNPGLLWIWSSSARPVGNSGNNKKHNGINGEGRCLRLAYDPALRSYAYKGSECSMRYNYICEQPENTSSNEINRIGRNKKIFDEL